MSELVRALLHNAGVQPPITRIGHLPTAHPTSVQLATAAGRIVALEKALRAERVCTDALWLGLATVKEPWVVDWQVGKLRASMKWRERVTLNE